MKYLIEWTDGKGSWARRERNLIETAKVLRSIFLRKGRRRPQLSVMITRKRK